MSGLRGIVTPNATADGPLRLDDLVRAMDAIRNAPPHPCRLGQHVIAPRSTPGAWTRCGNCARPVKVPADWGRR